MKTRRCKMMNLAATRLSFSVVPSANTLDSGLGSVNWPATSSDPRIVRVDWLLDMAMSQDLRATDEYELDESLIEDVDE